MPAQVCIDPVGEADFPVLARLGETIWRQTYPGMISSAQIDYMLAGRFAPERLRQYLGATDRGLYLVRLAGEPVGYFSYAATASAGQMKLEQLYLLAECRGQGLGGHMMRIVEARAREQACRVLCLTVNKANAQAIAVYRKAGFAVRESVVFDIGNGYVMDDYLMEKNLG
jgi:ribosomal protein S18 acetylase RimI-like enzyme